MTDGSPRVVDFSTHMSGPLASHLMCELGADVVKVERPGSGDGNRGLEPLVGGRGLFHDQLNSGARSIAVSTSSTHWPEVVAACAAWADAVIVGARPVDARRRGLDFESLVRHNPQLVYCSISGYGERGPWTDLPAHGQTIDALAGLVPVVSDHDGNPTTPTGWRTSGPALAGVFGALGVYAGLHRRDRGGGAQYVTTSLWGAAMWWSWRDLVCQANLDRPWNEYGDLGTRYSMYWTSDDRVILACPIEQRLWERFCDVLNLPESWKDHGSWSGSGMEFGATQEFAHERAVIAERMRGRTLQEWTEALAAAEIAFAPVLTTAEALQSEHAHAAHVMRPTEVLGREVQIAAAPVRFDADQTSTLHAPELDEHRSEVMRMLGLDHLDHLDLSS